MVNSATAFLKNEAVNGWRLFSLISIPINLVIGTAMTRVDLANVEDISSLLGVVARINFKPARRI
jgi:hypothetical protein